MCGVSHLIQGRINLFISGFQTLKIGIKCFDDWAHTSSSDLDFVFWHSDQHFFLLQNLAQSIIRNKYSSQIHDTQISLFPIMVNYSHLCHKINHVNYNLFFLQKLNVPQRERQYNLRPKFSCYQCMENIKNLLLQDLIKNVSHFWSVPQNKLPNDGNTHLM